MIKNDRDSYIFKSGKELYCNKNIIGINNELSIYSGYDDDLNYEIDGLTKEEREELADFMIDLWTEFKNDW